MAVTLTEKASKQVKKLMEEQKLEQVFLRMGVKGSGCSGSLLAGVRHREGQARQDIRDRRAGGGGRQELPLPHGTTSTT